MIKVGFVVLEAVLSPLCEPQEPLYSQLADVNGENEQQLRRVVREVIKPYYESFDSWSKEVISDSVWYFSLADELPAAVCFDALPIPFDLPQDLKRFCLYLQEELGVEKEWFETSECEYSDDLSLVHRLRRSKRGRS